MKSAGSTMRSGRSPIRRCDLWRVNVRKAIVPHVKKQARAADVRGVTTTSVPTRAGAILRELAPFATGVVLAFALVPMSSVGQDLPRWLRTVIFLAVACAIGAAVRWLVTYPARRPARARPCPAAVPHRLRGRADRDRAVRRRRPLHRGQPRALRDGRQRPRAARRRHRARPRRAGRPARVARRLPRADGRARVSTYHAETRLLPCRRQGDLVPAARLARARRGRRAAPLHRPGRGRQRPPPRRRGARRGRGALPPRLRGRADRDRPRRPRRPLPARQRRPLRDHRLHRGGAARRQRRPARPLRRCRRRGGAVRPADARRAEVVPAGAPDRPRDRPLGLGQPLRLARARQLRRAALLHQAARGHLRPQALRGPARLPRRPRRADRPLQPPRLPARAGAARRGRRRGRRRRRARPRPLQGHQRHARPRRRRRGDRARRAAAGEAAAQDRRARPPRRRRVRDAARRHLAPGGRGGHTRPAESRARAVGRLRGRPSDRPHRERRHRAVRGRHAAQRRGAARQRRHRDVRREGGRPRPPCDLGRDRAAPAGDDRPDGLVAADARRARARLVRALPAAGRRPPDRPAQEPRAAAADAQRRTAT